MAASVKSLENSARSGVSFALGIVVSVLSAIAIWQASPGKVRAVAGRIPQG